MKNSQKRKKQVKLLKERLKKRQIENIIMIYSNKINHSENNPHFFLMQDKNFMKFIKIHQIKFGFRNNILNAKDMLK